MSAASTPDSDEPTPAGRSPEDQPEPETVEGPLGPLWPASARVDPATGELSLGGVPASQLARTVGTPAYVIDEAAFRARASLFRSLAEDAFMAEAGALASAFYAGKALLTTQVARWALDAGLGIDVCTDGEMAVARAARIPGARLGLQGNDKSDAEIARAVADRYARIVVDSDEEIDRIVSAARRAGRTRTDPVPIFLRVTTGVHAGGHEYVSTAHEDQKFGIPFADGEALAAARHVLDRAPELQLEGLHAHIGSQIVEPEAFEASAAVLLMLREEIAESFTAGEPWVVPEIDFGGGFGVPYAPGDPELDLPGALTRLAQVVARSGSATGLPPPRVSFEPGRWIVAPTTVTLYTVGTVKRVPVEDGERLYVAVDGGMSDNIRPALYGARYTASLAGRVSEATPVRARVVGKHCESGDIVVQDVDLPADVHRGDLLAVPVTGAYGRSMASNYNLVPRPPVVAVRDGAVSTLVRRETIDDLLALDEG